MHEELPGGEEAFVLRAVLVGDTFFVSDMWEGEQSSGWGAVEPQEAFDKAGAMLRPEEKVHMIAALCGVARLTVEAWDRHHHWSHLTHAVCRFLFADGETVQTSFSWV